MSDREILSIDDLPDNAKVPEVAEFLRQTKEVIRAMIRNGDFPNAYRLGRDNIIPKKDVIAFMEKVYGNLGYASRKEKNQ